MLKWQNRLLFIIALIVLTVSPTLKLRADEHVSIELSDSERGKKHVHRVVRGENLSTILKKYGVSLKNVLKSNRWLRNTPLTLSIDDKVTILTKDMNKVSHRDIDIEIKVYMEVNGYTKSSGDIITSLDKEQDNTQKDTISNEEVERLKELATYQKDYIYSPQSDFSDREGVNIKVAILMPFYDEKRGEDNEFASFYKGALIALDQLKRINGISTTVSLIDTGERLVGVDTLITYNLLDGYDIIVGPVYQDQFDMVANYFKDSETVVISPLSPITSVGDNIFQVSPIADTRYDKLADFVKDKNVIMYKTYEDDPEFYDMATDLVDSSAYKSYIIHQDSMENVDYVLFKQWGEEKFLGTMTGLIRHRANITDSTLIEIEFLQREDIDTLTNDTTILDTTLIMPDSLMTDSLMVADSLSADSVEADTMMYYRIKFISKDSTQYTDSDSSINIGSVIDDIPLRAMTFISNTDELLLNALDRKRENVIIVSANNHSDIELILSKVAGLRRRFNVKVLGSPEFARVEGEKRRDYFSSDTHYITSYHTDRFSSKNKAFETEYVDAFGEIPTLFSYRAYDVVSLFVMLVADMGSEYSSVVDNQLFVPMRAGYRFINKDGRFVNTEWMFVRYMPNYKIDVN